MKNKLSLADAKAEWSAIYKEVLPTMSVYQQRAQRLVELQIEIFGGEFRAQFPKAAHNKETLILKISAREMPSKLDKLLTDLAKRDINVTRVIYDAHTFEFYLFGPSEPEIKPEERPLSQSTFK